MRLLHLAPRLSTRGGADQHLLALLSELGKDHPQHLAVGLSGPAILVACQVSKDPGLAASGLEESPTPIRFLDDLVDRIQPDLIHVHNVVSPGVLEWLQGRPVLMTVQDHRLFCPGRGKWTSSGLVCEQPMSVDRCAKCFTDEGYFQTIMDLTRRRLAAVSGLRLAVLSEYMRRELVAVGHPSDRIEVIPPFVHDLNFAPKPEAEGIALIVGRLVAAKGIQDAVEAWRASGLDLPLVLAGTGPLRAGLERDGLDVRGWLDRRALGMLLGRAKVMILAPRWQEPFGIAGLEALAAGVPVAAWRSGGLSEWHPGDHLVEWGDGEGLAAAIREAAGHGAQPAYGFGRRPLMKRLAQVYGRVLDAAG